MPTLVDGIDISFSQPSAPWAVARWHEGNRIFAQCLWTGGYESQGAVKLVAEGNLRTFREAGYLTLGYINANPDWGAKWEPDVAVQVAKANAGAEWEHISEVVIDFEIEGTPWARVWGAVEAVRAAGKTCKVIYTGKYVIDAVGQPDAAEFARYGMSLWRTGNAGWPPFAPWTTGPVGWQMGETTLDGVKYDFNKFDLDFFAPAQPQGGDDMIQYEKDAGAALAALNDGDVIRGAGDYQVYRVSKDADGNRRKRHVTDQATAAREGIDLAHVKEVPALTVALLKPGDDIG